VSKPRSLPIRVQPLPDEALDSWFEAIAHRYGVWIWELWSAAAIPARGVATVCRSWIGSNGGKGPRSREDAVCAVAGLRPRRCAEQFLAVRRHALPSMKHPRRLSPGPKGVPELLVAQPQPRLLVGRHNRRPLGLPGLASQGSHQATHRRRHLGSGSYRGQPVLRLAGERKEPAVQPDPAPTAAATVTDG
jgi:hypothetical protein